MTEYTPEHAAAIADSLAYDPDGLVPAVAQQHDTGEVLMLAWMSRDAVIQTLTTGQVTYHSRSRGALWRKGATSGNTQRLVAFRVDCDADTVLVLIDQTGPACHTGRRTCFYREAGAQGLREVAAAATSN
jgi:phosphoribosyl-AMP cyclohydrolase